MGVLTTGQRARQVARELRKNPTQAEKKLWSKLRKKQFMGYKFLFQHPVFYRTDNRKRFFILDFYCHELKLGVEVDGEIHKAQQEYDQIRTDILETKGIRVLRFENERIMSNVNNVLIEMSRFVNEI